MLECFAVAAVVLLICLLGIGIHATEWFLEWLARKVSKGE